MSLGRDTKVLFRLTVAALLLNLLVMGLGAFVASSGYGLVIPNWPDVGAGEWIPATWDEGKGVVFAHRVLVTIAGLVTILLGTFAWSRDDRRPVQRMGLCLIPLMAGNIALGGWGVSLQFPWWLKAGHALASFGLVGVLAAMATVSSEAWFRESQEGSVERALVKKARALLSTVSLQILFGVFVRHAPSTGVFGLFLFLHFLMAMGIAATGVSLAMAFGQKGLRQLKSTAWAAVALIVLQFLLGFVLVFTGRMAGATSVGYVHQSVTHVVAGALLLTSALSLWLLALRGAKNS